MADLHLDVDPPTGERSFSGNGTGVADAEGGKEDGQSGRSLQRARTIKDRLHADFLFTKAQNSHTTFSAQDGEAATVELAWMVPHSLFRYILPTPGAGAGAGVETGSGWPWPWLWL